MKNNMTLTIVIKKCSTFIDIQMNIDFTIFFTRHLYNANLIHILLLSLISYNK